MKVTLTRYTEDPVLAIEEAASNCYDSTPTGDGKIMRNCIKSGHTSVMEFATFTFHIEGVSRALLAQLTRHRHAGYAVRSQRYCSENDFEFVTPYSVRKDKNLNSAYKDFMNKICQMYTDLQELGIPNEDARYVLPNACCTTLELTINMRSLMNFMNERLCSCAQWEIRELASLMKRSVSERFPELGKVLVPKCEKNGTEYGFCTESAKRTCGRQPLLKDVYKKGK